MSNFGVVSTITAPLLSSATQPSLILFKTEYNAYKLKVEDVNRTRGDGEKIKPASIKSFLEPALLKSLCLLGKFSPASSIDQVGDEQVESWFANRLRSKPRELSEKVRTALDSVTYEQCAEDPAGAALTFVINIIKALDKHNASEVVSDDERRKGLISKLIHKLEPHELRIRIRDAHECWSKEEKCNLSFFSRKNLCHSVRRCSK